MMDNVGRKLSVETKKCCERGQVSKRVYPLSFDVDVVKRETRLLDSGDGGWVACGRGDMDRVSGVPNSARKRESMCDKESGVVDNEQYFRLMAGPTGRRSPRHAPK